MGIFLISILLVALLTFLLTLLIFSRISRNTNHLTNPFYWITSFIAAPIVYIGILFVWFKISSSYPERDFDKNAWLLDENNRYEYVDDLVDHHKLDGKTKTEVIEMLGEASGEYDSILTYYIGYSPKIFLNSDPDWLEVRLKNDIVDTVVIVP